jgi:hypothetical protein
MRRNIRIALTRRSRVNFRRTGEEASRSIFFAGQRASSGAGQGAFCYEFASNGGLPPHSATVTTTSRQKSLERRFGQGVTGRILFKANRPKFSRKAK